MNSSPRKSTSQKNPRKVRGGGTVPDLKRTQKHNDTRVSDGSWIGKKKSQVVHIFGDCVGLLMESVLLGTVFITLW